MMNAGMSHTIFLIATLALPTVLLTVLRINAVMVFLSLCLGDVLVRYVASDANTMLGLFAPNMSPVSTSTVQLAVLLIPVILTSAFMLFSVHGRGRAIMNILPALGTGSLLVLLVVPLLPAATRAAVQEQMLWHQAAKLQALIVGVSAIIGLFFLWAQRRRSATKED